jgi:hypothetical protein
MREVERLHSSPLRRTTNELIVHVLVLRNRTVLAEKANPIGGLRSDVSHCFDRVTLVSGFSRALDGTNQAPFRLSRFIVDD